MQLAIGHVFFSPVLADTTEVALVLRDGPAGRYFNLKGSSLLRDKDLQLDSLEKFKLGLVDLPEEEQSVRSNANVWHQPLPPCTTRFSTLY